MPVACANIATALLAAHSWLLNVNTRIARFMREAFAEIAITNL